MNSPCFGCTGRKPLCYGGCDRYQAFTADCKRENRARPSTIRANNDVTASKKAYKR